jgi:hypothetical protein
MNPPRLLVGRKESPAIQQFACHVSPEGSIVDGLPAILVWMNRQNKAHSEAEQSLPTPLNIILSHLWWF